MVAFATLLLGLVLGAGEVTLEVGEGVARVAVILDGSVIAETNAAPWTVPVDFGEELTPHELEAVAYDASGRVLGRARQWINRPRPPAEIAVVVEGGGADQTARLSWQSVTGERPLSTNVSVDGSPMAVADLQRIPLPRPEPGRTHVLHAELDFAGGVTASADVAFGGGRTDEAAARLTAVPVTVAPKAKLPKPERLGGWFEAHGEPLRVAAVEEGAAEIVIVPEASAKESFVRMRQQRTGALGFERARDYAALGKQQRLHLLWPVPQQRSHSGFQYSLFPRSQDLTSTDGGVLWLLTRPNSREPEPSERQRLADAVAAAALDAAARDRRRAVVLILGPAAPAAEEGRFTAETVRRYLSRIGVPLFVWCVGAERHAVWGTCADVSTSGRLQEAVRELRGELDRQRIVWVEGTRLPHTIALGQGAAGIALIR